VPHASLPQSVDDVELDTRHDEKNKRKKKKEEKKRRMNVYHIDRHEPAHVH
jgi:hypothetical protein